MMWSIHTEELTVNYFFGAIMSLTAQIMLFFSLILWSVSIISFISSSTNQKKKKSSDQQKTLDHPQAKHVFLTYRQNPCEYRDERLNDVSGYSHLAGLRNRPLFLWNCILSVI